MQQIAAVVAKKKLDEPDNSWTQYWSEQPMSDRIQMATELSMECFDGDPDQRLRRVHRVLRRPLIDGSPS